MLTIERLKLIKKTTLIATLLLSACSQTPVPVATPEPVPEDVAPVIEPVVKPAVAEELMGLSPSDIIIRMGPPNLVRRDGLGQVMLFEHDTCVFDVIFYADTIEAPYKVSYMSARTRQGQNIDKQLCLTAIKPNGFDNQLTSEQE